GRFKTIFLVDLVQSALLSLSSFHPVHRNNQSENIHVSLGFYNRKSFLNGSSCCGHILNDHNFITVFNRTSKKNSLISMVLYFFPVGTVTDIFVIFFRNRNRSRHAQWNSLVCRSE